MDTLTIKYFCHSKGVTLTIRGGYSDNRIFRSCPRGYSDNWGEGATLTIKCFDHVQGVTLTIKYFNHVQGVTLTIEYFNHVQGVTLTIGGRGLL